MKKKYHSHKYNQYKLKILSDSLCEEIDDLLEYLQIEYRQNGKMLSMPCPIHGGDNISALNLYPTGESYRGNWKCRTHHCEEYFKSSIIGFVRGVLSHQNHGWNKDGDECCSFQEAIEFVQNFLKQNLSDIKINKKTIEKNKFVNTIKHIKSHEEENNQKIGRQTIVRNLSIPSQYFYDRGFSDKILIKYDVGECLNSGKEMFGRSVVPVYDKNYQFMVGCTGRSIFEKCNKCNSYHDPNLSCPNDSDIWKYSKWRHSHNFKTQENLYNFWFAKEHIQKTKSVILVESPGNVWRLEESGIHNSVAIFGSNLADRQKLLLDISGAMTILLLMDNDKAGTEGAEKIIKKCQKTYNIKTIKIDAPDVGGMNVEEVKKVILPQIEIFL
jgi:5S rRNA maturation endonuclease (ribonuclease M5)